MRAQHVQNLVTRGARGFASSVRPGHLADNYHPVLNIVRAQGHHVWDNNGIGYFDALCGYGALPFGHGDPDVIAAMKVQMENGLLVTSRALGNPVIRKWADTICAFTGYERVLPMSSGAEGVETGLRIAMRNAELNGLAPNTGRVICARGGFHGRTGAISASYEDPSYSAGNLGNPTRWIHVDYGDLKQLETALAMPGVVAFLVEPVQGEAGAVVPPRGYLSGAMALCKKNGVLSIADTVQTGFGRLGMLHGFEDELGKRKPDITVFGKGYSGGSGTALSGALTSAELMDATMKAGTYGSTFGGNPLACAASIAAIKKLQRDRLIEQSAELGAYALPAIRGELSPYGKLVKEVRGKGNMWGIEFNGPYAEEFVRKMRVDHHIICKGAHDNSVRFLPPLTCKKQDVEQVIEAIGLTVASMAHTRWQTAASRTTRAHSR